MKKNIILFFALLNTLRTFGVPVIDLSLHTQGYSTVNGKREGTAAIRYGSFAMLFNDDDTLRRIGSVMFNNITHKVEYFILKDDEKYSTELERPKEPARFLSVDPMAKQFPELSPYQYASDNPIMNIDLDGLEGSPPQKVDAGYTNPQDNGYTPPIQPLVPNPYESNFSYNPLDPYSNPVDLTKPYQPPPPSSAGSTQPAPTYVGPEAPPFDVQMCQQISNGVVQGLSMEAPGAVFGIVSDAFKVDAVAASVEATTNVAATTDILATATTEGTAKAATDVAAQYTAIGSTRVIGEEALKQYGGLSNQYFKTSLGARFVDQYVETTETAYEAKVGYTTLNSRTALQVAKDKELLLEPENKIKQIYWNFYKSPVTGRVGPSAKLLKALENAGIKVNIIQQ